jgi:hypothetical protein
MSSERTLASTFFAAFRLNYAEFAGEMQVLDSDHKVGSTQKPKRRAIESSPRYSPGLTTVYSSRKVCGGWLIHISHSQNGNPKKINSENMAHLSKPKN